MKRTSVNAHVWLHTKDSGAAKSDANIAKRAEFAIDSVGGIPIAQESSCPIVLPAEMTHNGTTVMLTFSHPSR